MPADVRNGLPEHRPYVWSGDDDAREAEVAAELAAVRAEVVRRIEEGGSAEACWPDPHPFWALGGGDET